MRRMTLALVPPLVASLAYLVACSSDASPPPAAGVDAGSDDVAVQGESLTVLVVAMPSPPNGQKGFPGATVIFDKPGGERVETETGPDGLATLTGIDWSLGKASLTVFGPGTVVTSYVELTKEGIAQLEGEFSATAGEPRRDLTVFAVRDESQNPKLTGKVSNAVGNEILLSTSNGGQWQGGGGTYSMAVKPDTPFSIFSVEHTAPETQSVGPRGRETEIKRWAKIDHPAVTADTTFDIDLAAASPLVPTKVKGKLIIPGGDTGPLGGSSSALVFVHDDSGFGNVGLSSKVDLTADGSAFDFDLEYVPIEGGAFQTQAIIFVPDGSLSMAFTHATPAEGMVLDGFLPPPVVVETSRSLSEPFSFEGFPDGARPRITLVDSRGPRWFVDCPRGTTSATLPVLEGAAKTALGKPTRGAIGALSAHDPARSLYTRAAFSREFRVK
jgi:hypothetical protein